MDSVKRAHIFVSGRVQGVFFRGNARKRAEELLLTGWVKNLPDGRVEIVCEGVDEDVEAFIAWCREGSRLAKVERTEVEYEDYRGEFAEFEIRET